MTPEELAAKIEVWATELEVGKRKMEPDVFSVNTPTVFKEAWSYMDTIVCRMRETIDDHKTLIEERHHSL